MADLTDLERDVLNLLCNCARSMKRHSTYCPAATAAPMIRRAMALAYHRLVKRLAIAERERDEALAELLARPAPDGGGERWPS